MRIGDKIEAYGIIIIVLLSVISIFVCGIFVLVSLL